MVVWLVLVVLWGEAAADDDLQVPGGYVGVRGGGKTAEDLGQGLGVGAGVVVAVSDGEGGTDGAGAYRAGGESLLV